MTLVYWQDLNDEIRGLAQYARRSRARFIVLVPRRFIANRLRKEIGDEAQLSVRGVLEIPLLQERLALGALVANPRDRVALHAFLTSNTHKPTDSPRLSRLIDSERVSNVALLEALATGVLKILGPASKDIASRAKEAYAAIDSPIPRREKLIAAFDPRLAKAIDDEDDRASAQDLLQSIRDFITLALKEHSDNLDSVMDALCYSIRMGIPLAEQKDSRVRLVTHDSEIRQEADVVVFAGAADQMVVNAAPTTPAEAEMDGMEKRRLLDTLCAHARSKVVVSWPLCIDCKDAAQYQVRVDQGAVRRRQGREVVMLRRLGSIPELQKSMAGTAWLQTFA